MVGSRAVVANEPEAQLAPQGAVPRYCRCNVERPTGSVARRKGDTAVHRPAVLDGEELGYLLKRASDYDLYLTNRWGAGELHQFRLSSVRLEDQHRGSHLRLTRRDEGGACLIFASEGGTRIPDTRIMTNFLLLQTVLSEDIRRPEMTSIAGIGLSRFRIAGGTNRARSSLEPAQNQPRHLNHSSGTIALTAIRARP